MSTITFDLALAIATVLKNSLETYRPTTILIADQHALPLVVFRINFESAMSPDDYDKAHRLAIRALHTRYPTSYTNVSLGLPPEPGALPLFHHDDLIGAVVLISDPGIQVEAVMRGAMQRQFAGVLTYPSNPD